ncbi:response regulator transcription factor [Lyngbya confervoides]|uniref:Response regulator transcription factor n=1 Tax=Lyngbya confervoides BDU141951 TaxID=1574623 RepID=A0ABD4T986_9CYAN|nr:response regulator transcription factor [Lyngbya confervoides]MCM1984835.1 response regulator transcription factor [Lyngbya confervoides BDU141951]
MKILIVEDDKRIAQPLAEDLQYQNHAVDIALDGEMGWHCTQATDYDLILLDVMLPKLDGIALCKKIRQSGSTAFVLMLTARDTTADKVLGLDAGADDYLIKPFELEELSARIRALSRRSREVSHPVLSHGKLQLDPGRCTVTYNQQPLDLTPKEYMILELFLKHPGQVLTRSAILDRLWNFDQVSGEQTVKTHLTNLRRKLKVAGASGKLIETVYGLGYRLNQRKK